MDTKIICRIFLMSAAWLSAGADADTVTTLNGSSVTGQIHGITKETVLMQTDFAGELTINRSQIRHLITDLPLTVTLPGGRVLTGVVELTKDGTLSLKSGDLISRFPARELVSGRIPIQDPTVPTMTASNWKYVIAADINGRKGNSDEMGTMIRTEALLEGDRELKLYASIDRGKQNGQSSSDETIIGSSYVTYTSDEDRWGWFVNSEFERDRFESIDLRAAGSSGVSFRVFNQPDHSLQIQTGLGYRHETFTDDTSDGTPTLDLGLKHALTVTSWLHMTNTLSFVPSLTDFGDYLLLQDSGLNMPIGDSDLSLRVGIKNNYNDPPVAGREQLDTIYYSRLLFRFD